MQERSAVVSLLLFVVGPYPSSCLPNVRCVVPIHPIYHATPLIHPSPPAIREYDAKQLLSYWLPRSPVPIPCKSESSVAPVKVAQVQWSV